MYSVLPLAIPSPGVDHSPDVNPPPPGVNHSPCDDCVRYAPLIWKVIAGHHNDLSQADLVGIDKTFMDHIARVRNPLIKSQEDFQKQFANLHFAVKTSAPLSSFPPESEEGDAGGAGTDAAAGGKDRGEDEDNADAPGSQGREWCDLVPNGGKTKVTLSNRNRYVDLAIQYRLHEFDEAAAAMRSGLGMLVPERALRLCTGMDLEILVRCILFVQENCVSTFVRGN